MRGALLYSHEAGDAHLGAGLLHGRDPLGQAVGLVLGLGLCGLLLTNDLAAFVHHEVLFGEPALGAVRGAREHPAHGAVDDLLLLGPADPARGALRGAARGPAAATLRALRSAGTAL